MGVDSFVRLEYFIDTMFCYVLTTLRLEGDYIKLYYSKDTKFLLYVVLISIVVPSESI